MTQTDPTDPGGIDLAALRRLLDLLGNDPGELAELLGDYLEDAPDLASRMVAAAAIGDRDAYRIAAHTLKSNARDFGAVRLSDLCAAAEAASRTSTDPGELAAAANDIVLAEQAARETLSGMNPETLGGAGDDR